MARIFTDLPDEDIKWLDQLAVEQGKSCLMKWHGAVLSRGVRWYRVKLEAER